MKWIIVPVAILLLVTGMRWKIKRELSETPINIPIRQSFAEESENNHSIFASIIDFFDQDEEEELGKLGASYITASFPNYATTTMSFSNRISVATSSYIIFYTEQQ